MIDLHCHMLPGLDDGARDLDTALRMAHAAVEDGICAVVCTPHITPGIYDNDAAVIHQAASALAAHLQQAGLSLPLYVGADIRITPDMGRWLKSGTWPTIAGTRYFLFEPDHNIAMPGMVALAGRLLAEGLVPVLTHPERLRWIDGHYELVRKLWKMGCVVQITAGAITGRFGDAARRWSERMLADGLVDVIATDAHNMHRRPPLLREGFEAAADIVGRERAWAMVYETPLAILNDQPIRRPLPARQQAGRHHKQESGSQSLLRSLKKVLTFR